jgi:hypothetical protein
MQLANHLTTEHFAAGKMFLAALTLGASVNPYQEKEEIEIDDPLTDKELQKSYRRLKRKRN